MTPGPWQALKDGRQGHSVQHKDAGGNTLLLAYVHGINEGSTANAKAVAAVPEMLQALEAIAEEIPTLWGDNVVSGRLTLSLPEGHIDTLFAAIAKARGRS